MGITMKSILCVSAVAACDYDNKDCFFWFSAGGNTQVGAPAPKIANDGNGGASQGTGNLESRNINIQELKDLGKDVTYENWKEITMKKYQHCNPDVDIESMEGVPAHASGLNHRNCGLLANLEAGAGNVNNQFHSVQHHEMVLLGWSDTAHTVAS